MVSSRAEKKKFCESCKARFGLTTHKHSCKRCKAIICSECYKQRLQIAGYIDKKAHKICVNCSEDHQHNMNLTDTGKISWGVDSNIMKQWLKNINTVNTDELQKQYENALQRKTYLTESQQFQEYIFNIDQQVKQDNTSKYFSQSFLEMLYKVWSGEIDITKVKASVINVLKGFFSEFPVQESPLTFKQEYVDVAIFLLFFGSESSACRVMKEIYGIIIPIECVAHISNNDFTFGEKYLMNFLLDKIKFKPTSHEAAAIYCFIQDKGIEFINSFFINRSNFQVSYQIFNFIINMPYNRRWSELLRILGIFILENQEIIGQHYGKNVWDELKLDLLINTKWKLLKEKMDVFCLFQVDEDFKMNRFSMIDDLQSQDIDSIVHQSKEDVLEENKMLKIEVFQIFKVKQLILEKSQQVEDLRQELQKRDVSQKLLEETQIKLTQVNKDFQTSQQQHSDLQQMNKALQEKLFRIEAQNSRMNFTKSCEDSALLISFQKGSPEMSSKRSESMTTFNLQKISSDSFFDMKDDSPKKQQQSQQQKEINILPQEVLEQDNSNPDKGQKLLESQKSKIFELEQINSDLQKQNKILSQKFDQMAHQFNSQGDQILKSRQEKIKKEEEIEILKSKLELSNQQIQKITAQHQQEIETLTSQYGQQIESIHSNKDSQQIQQQLEKEIITLKEKVQNLNIYNQILQQEKANILTGKFNISATSTNLYRSHSKELQDQTNSDNQQDDNSK